MHIVLVTDPSLSSDLSSILVAKIKTIHDIKGCSSALESSIPHTHLTVWSKFPLAHMLNQHMQTFRGR